MLNTANIPFYPIFLVLYLFIYFFPLFLSFSPSISSSPFILLRAFMLKNALFVSTSHWAFVVMRGMALSTMATLASEWTNDVCENGTVCLMFAAHAQTHFFSSPKTNESRNEQWFFGRVCEKENIQGNLSTTNCNDSNRGVRRKK